MGKIIIIASVFPPDAVTSSYLNFDLANSLSSDKEVVVLRPFPSRPKGVIYQKEDLIQSGKFKTILLKSYTYPSSRLIGRMHESISFALACKKYLKKHHDEIDLVYNHSWHLFGYYIIAKTAVRYGIPYMVPVQDIYPESLMTNRRFPRAIQQLVMKTLGWMDKYTLRNAARVRTISEEMRSYLIKTRNLDPAHIFAVDNWQDDTEHLYVPLLERTSHFVFEYVGSINAHSNVDLIIRAFSNANIHNAELKIYGGGDNKEHCVTLVKELGLTNVVFDYVKREQVPSVQADATVLVLALSKGNGAFSLPSKVTSYMLSGRPLLVSIDDESATSRYIREADCGIVVPPGSLDLLSEAFKVFCSLPFDRLSAMGRHARSFAETRLTREHNLSIVVNHINSILKDGREKDVRPSC